MRRLLPFLVSSWVAYASFPCCDEHMCALTTWEDSQASSLSLLQRGASLKRQATAHPEQIAGFHEQKPVAVQSAAKSKSNLPFDPKISGSRVLRSVAWSIPVLLGGLVIANIFAGPSGISYGICGALLSGLNGYVIGISADFTRVATSPASGLAFMGWVWLFFAVCAVGFNTLFSFTTATYQEEWTALKVVPGKVWVSYLFVSVFGCAGEALVQLVCGQSLDGSAPHTAIATAYCIVAAPFFWFYMGERMSPGQICGFLAVIMGVFMEGFSGWALTCTSLVVMLLWSMPCIFIRLGELWGSPPCVGVVVRFAFISVCGAVTTTLCHTVLGVPFMSADMFLTAGYLSVIVTLAYWSWIRAFGASACQTGVVTGILASQTVVMCLMNSLVMGWQPTLFEVFGMSLVVLGCVMMCWFTSTSKQTGTEGEVGIKGSGSIKETVPVVQPQPKSSLCRPRAYS